MKYTDDKNAQIVLALLKKFKIKNIVVSPGTTNVPIARSVQQDSYFNVYSVVDERSAAYFATGIAYVTGEPVVISCTGATASRNYLSGLTEAYYRKLPIIALTSQHFTSDYNNLVPQVTDRRNTQNDIKKFQAMLPHVKDDKDFAQCVLQVNYALHCATEKGGGPVHINLPVSTDFSFSTEKLPDVDKIDYYNAETIDTLKLEKEIKNKKVAVFIGSHNIFSDSCIKEINKFVKKYDIPVFYDHTSSYVGENGVLTAQISDLLNTNNLPDILIDLGGITGDYSASRLFKNIETWRVSEDGVYNNRLGVEKLMKVFECSEGYFFKQLNKGNFKTKSYFSELKCDIEKISLPNLPLSNTYISMMLSKNIPKGSLLHLGILNSLRNMNFFNLDKTITVSCNVGGFGIDGPLSSAVGQSIAQPERLTFALLGDLAFFYDMNILGNRHINKNLRVLLVNNNVGVEFRVNPVLERQWGSDTNEFIAASGHNCSAELWAKSVGFTYLSATNKEEFDNNLMKFCSKESNSSIILEVFTDVLEEQQSLDLIRNMNRPIKQTKTSVKAKIIQKIKKEIKKK